MKKQTITREENIQAVFDLKAGYTLGLADVEILKRVARMALAAMDSEPGCLPLDYLQGHKDGMEWAAKLAESNHPQTGDWLYDDPIELAKAIRKGPDMPPAQSADSEPVAWIVHARTGDQLTTDGSYVANAEGILGLHSTPLYRHAQQPVVKPMMFIDGDISSEDADKLAKVIQEFNEEDERPLAKMARIIRENPHPTNECNMPKAQPQPAPVVPEDVLDALQKVARIRLDLNDFDGDRRGIADCLGDAEEALIEVVNRRAAMLQAGTLNNEGTKQAGNSPVIPGSSVIGWIRTDYQQDFQVNCTAPQFVMGSSDPSSAWGVQYMPVTKADGPQNAPHNIPEIIPGWIPVSERMPETDGNYWGWWSESKRQGPVWFIKSETQAQFQSYEITHWMPLPAAPQEVPDGK